MFFSQVHCGEGSTLGSFFLIGVEPNERLLGPGVSIGKHVLNLSSFNSLSLIFVFQRF